MTVIDRPWGQEIIFAETPTYMGKILKRCAGTKGDLQSHLKHESHYLSAGRLIVRTLIDGALTEASMEPGDAWHVPAGVVHQEEALTDCVEFEVAEPTLNDRHVVESAAGLPSTPHRERLAMAYTLAHAYQQRADELYAAVVLTTR